jgi:hypothetical protein
MAEKSKWATSLSSQQRQVLDFVATNRLPAM